MPNTFQAVTGGGYRDPVKTMTIKALEERQKEAALAAQKAAQVPEQIADPWQGMAHLAGVLSTGMQQGRADTAAASQREALARLKAGFGPEGPTPEQVAQVGVIDPESAKFYEQEAYKARAQEDQQKHAIDLQTGQQTFTHGENVESRTATAAENELNRQADDARQRQQDAAAAGRQDDQQAAAQDLARIQADLETEKAKTASGIKTAEIGADVDARIAEAKKLGLVEGTKEWNHYTATGDIPSTTVRPGDMYTPGQTKEEQDFAVQKQDYENTGRSIARINVQHIGNAIKDMEAARNDTIGVTGPGMGMVPDVVKSALSPKTIAARDSMRNAVQSSLKAVLGTQFTQVEGSGLLDRIFNENLEEGENIRRAKLVLQQIQEISDNMEKKIQYYNTPTETKPAGSIMGYQAPQADLDKLLTLNEELRIADEGGGGSEAPAPGAPAPGATATGGAPANDDFGPVDPSFQEGDTNEWKNDDGTKIPLIVKDGKWVRR